MTQLLFFLLASSVAVRLPRRLLSILAAAVGVAAYICARRTREAVDRNLSIVAPELDERARRRLAFMTFIHGAWSYAEFLALSKKHPSRLPDEVQVSGWNHLDRALQGGHGVIMVTAHLGAAWVAGQLVAQRGIPTTLVVERLRPPPLHDLMVRLRRSAGMRQVTAGRAALREVVAALRRNEIVGIVCDRDVAGSGEMLPFFGHLTRVTTAPATISLRTRAPVVPAVAYRSGPFAAVARIEEALEMPRTGATTRDVREGTLRIMARIERFIREHPEQWVVFTDVWPQKNHR